MQKLRYSVIIFKILHVKVENGCSNKSFDKVLQIFKDFLPEGHVVRASVYEAKKLLHDLAWDTRT